MGCRKISTEREIYRSHKNVKKEERSKINNLCFHFRKLKKEEQIKSKVSARKEIIRIRAEINEFENRKSTEKINETESWFFEKINKIDKPLASLTKKQRQREDTNY